MRLAAVRIAATGLLATACGGLAGDIPAGHSTSPEMTEATMAGFTNPVYDRDFPDPAVIRVGDTWYAYATNSALGNVPILRSDDLVTWGRAGDAMPVLAPWVIGGRTWAPEVAVHASDRYVMYYTAHDKASQRQCVGRAVASSPTGPFTDASERPLICQDTDGGSIDASPFSDADGTRYLLWKNDGNAIGVDSWIYAQPMTQDGLALTGEPTRLLRQDQPWEGPLVEAPFMWLRSGRYYLFYSANGYATADYAVGYAVCEGPLGPCAKPETTPILSTTRDAAGPGHCVLIEHDGRTWMVHHAWPPDAVGSALPGRTMWLTELTWRDGQPMPDGPRSQVPRAP